MLVIVKRAWGLRDYLKSLEDPGRKKGKPVGSYIDDLAALRKAIVLCDFCVKGFNAKHYRYHRQTEYPYVRGNCDACRRHSDRASLFMPEENVPKCWVTRDENARSRRKATIV